MLKFKIVIVGCHDERDEIKVINIIKLILTLIFPPSVAL
jgi:hypothetical protein